MGISVVDNFSYLGKKPLDSRDQVKTLADLLNIAEYDLDEGHITLVLDEKQQYQFYSDNAMDPTTGKWRKYETGGGGAGDGKILVNANDTAQDYIEKKLDVNTLETVNDNEIRVKGIHGMQTTVTELNFVQGLDKNIMDYVTMFEKGMEFKGFLDDDAALAQKEQAGPKEGDTYIVKSSATYGGEPRYFTWAEKQPVSVPPQYGFEAWPIPGGGQTEKMLHEGGTLIDMAGLVKGTVVKGLSAIEILEKALWPYQKPEAKISVNVNTYYEKDVDRINSYSVTVTASKKSADISEVRLYIGGTLKETITDMQSGGSRVFAYTSTPITDTTTFKVEVEDAEGSVVSASQTTTFVHRLYYGYVTNGTVVDQASITTLQKNGLQGGKGLTYSGLTCQNSQVVYAYDAALGNLSSILDGNGFQYLGSFTKSNVSINGVNYNVYVLTTAMSITNGKMVFS